MTSSTPEPSSEETQSSFSSDENEETLSPASSDEAGDNRSNGFLASTYEELKLVVWPSRQQLFSESIAVILMVALSAASIAAVSRFYGWGASQVFR